MQWIKMGEAHLLELSKQEQVISVLLTYTTDLLQEGCSSAGWIFLDNNKNLPPFGANGKKERAPQELLCLPWTQSHPQLIWSLVRVGGENSWGLCWYPRREGRAPSHLSGYKGPSILTSHGCFWASECTPLVCAVPSLRRRKRENGLLHPIPSPALDWN